MNMISGRSYSGSGGNDLFSLRDGILLSLLSMIKSKWNPVSLYDDQFQKWIKRDIDSVTRMKRNLEDWVNRLEDQDFCKYEGFYEAVKISNTLSFDKAMEYLVQALDSFRSGLDQTWEKMILDAPLDQEILTNIERWNNEHAFNDISEKYSLFEIEISETKFTATYGKYTGDQRGRFTKPILKSSRPGKELYESILINHLDYQVWSQVIEQVMFDEVDVKNPKDHWKEIKAFEAKALAQNITPVLLLGSTVDPMWMDGWINDYGRSGIEKPDDLSFKVDESIKESSYIGHLNDTEVHQIRGLVRNGYSLLMIKEAFCKLKFTKIGDGEIAHLFTEAGDTDEKINLVLTWRFEVEMKKEKAIAIRHNSSE
jgi:hypothetical protein